MSVYFAQREMNPMHCFLCGELVEAGGEQYHAAKSTENPRGGQICPVLIEMDRKIKRLEAPMPLILGCPSCGKRHVDQGEFKYKSHHTHSCQYCGVTWRPAVAATVGVQFLPGFLDGYEPGNEPTEPQ